VARRSDVDFVLMRFDLSTLSSGLTVERALFSYTVTNVGDQAEMHEFRRNWVMGTATYNSIPMPSAAWPFPQATIDTLWGPSVNDMHGNVARHTLDVTPSINRWLSGTPNNGWIFVPYFSNGCGIRTRADTTVANRPSLVLYLNYPPPPPPSPSPPSPSPPPPSQPPSFNLDFNGQNSIYTGGCQSTWIRSDTRNYIGARDTGVWWDGSSSVGHFDAVLVQFADIIGLGPYQLRPHEQIRRATLRYFVDTTFSTNAPGASASLHEISIPWNASVTTFNTFTGAQGLNEAEYRVPMVATAFATGAGWFNIDVTASVNRWINGTSNNGWIWLPTGGGDGSQIRACNAPADRRVNLAIIAMVQPPMPPSPPATPPPPPRPPSPPPSPPMAPLSVMTIDNAEHAWLRMSVAPTINYATATEIFWDGNSPYAGGAPRTFFPE